MKTDNSSQFCDSKIQMLLDKLDNVDETMKSLISDQIQNLDISPHARRFSPSAMLIYMKIFLYSPKIYRYLNATTLIFPSERHLRRYIYDLPTDVTSVSENKKYLSYKFSQLKPIEKILC